MGFWTRLFPRIPSWDWLQVEVTTRCDAACAYCPRTALRSRWQSRDMAPETFARLLPWLGRVRHVHLQGWGEPLSHPDFFRFLRAVKKQGCAAGCTTNATRADPGTLGRLVTEGLDVLAVSLAGTGPGHDVARRGTSLAAVVRALETLATGKAAAGVDHPRVHVAYMLLRSNLAEFDGLPELLSGLGVATVVVSTLDAVYAPALAAEAFSPMGSEDRRELAARITAVAERCRECGIAVHARLPRADGQVGPCPENPERAAVITVDGDVVPCVFAGLPLDNAASGPEARLSFGNIRETDLPAIWRAPAYAAFRRAQASGRLAGRCRHCPKPRLAPL